ncbi:MAG: hypothetical protein AAGE43_08020 [Pseudomonadota bacterium]
MALPDLAIINFSEIDDRDVRLALRAVNRQVVEDYMPIWGSGFYCKLHRREHLPGQPDVIEAEALRADAALFLVDRPRINAALSYCAINAAEIPVGFVFTDLGDWTVTLSHEVLELIVDSTLGFFLSEPEARVLSHRQGQRPPMEPMLPRRRSHTLSTSVSGGRRA